MEVTDARQAFLSRNEKCLELFYEQYESAQQSALQLIPLLFQINNRLLPGFNGADTPAGIYGYKPEKSLINIANQLNNRFKYEQETALRNTIIESIYIQRNVIDGQLKLWLIHIPGLKPDQCTELNDKLQRVLLWLKSRDLILTAQLTGSDRVCDFVDETSEYVSSGIFLDAFYAESFLLAGKYPVWWLVPPDKEDKYTEFVQHIKSARFVNEKEFIDIGGLAQANQNDVLKQAIKCIHSIYQKPENSWLNLLLLLVKQKNWPEIEGPAWRLKLQIYSADRNIEAAYPDRIYQQLILQAVKELDHTEHQMPVMRLFNQLRQYVKNVSDSFLNLLSTQQGSAQSILRLKPLDVHAYLKINKALFSEIRLVFSRIVSKYNETSPAEELQEDLNSIVRNMMVFLSDTESRVPVYNVRSRQEMVQGRVLIRHEMDGWNHGQWAFVLQLEQGEEKVIHGFSSLLALITWAWLNRLVDSSTQVSVDCPMKQVKQIEAHHVLEILIQQMNPDVISQIPLHVFDHPVHPLRSIVFVNLLLEEKHRKKLELMGGDIDFLSFGDKSENLATNCEQLILNSWGDVYTQSYSGNDGVLQCLCEWTHHAPLSSSVKPPGLQAFGYAAGESTFLAQRIEQVYEELVEFFYIKKQYSGRFIVRLAADYYFVEANDDVLMQQRMGDEKALYRYLEQPNREFKPYALERFALTETPLRQIFQRNKQNVVQVFYQLSHRTCTTWVLDEKGSLWKNRQPWFERESYVAHWLYVIRNIRNRLKNINYQNRELPSLEIQQISVNQLGGLEFYPIGAESISAERGFIEIKLTVVGHEEGDQINLICDGREFNYGEYGDQVLAECVQYLSARMRGEGRRPVYITDLDVPLRLYGVEHREDIQFVHFLKYKRNIENRLDHLLYG
ncbi:MAG: class I adenylate cyclase [Gammaproteobacteria bacterium]|nr:class I adenylate cyclase [Gammaproteobacteria bacterium]